MRYFLTFIFSFSALSSALIIKDDHSEELIIASHIFLYGDATDELSEELENEVNLVWNAYDYNLRIDKIDFRVIFEISFSILSENEVVNWARKFVNVDGYNFIRILNKPTQDVRKSFVVGTSNSGLWLEPQLIDGGLTASHEFGHILGLKHPEGIYHSGLPRMMITDFYQVDLPYRLEFTAGTNNQKLFNKLDRSKREVTIDDLNELELDKLTFNQNGESFLGSSRLIFIYDFNGNLIQF